MNTALLMLLMMQSWQPLFDRLPAEAKGWSLENGELHAKPAHPLRTADLFSPALYRDFEFEVEYRVSAGGNSGIRYSPVPDGVAGTLRPAMLFSALAAVAGLLLRRRRRLAIAAVLALLAPIPLVRLYLSRHPLALEFQVLDNERHRDGKRGALYRAGALYGLSPVLLDSSKPAGEWNHARILVCESSIQHWLNGTKVVEVDIESPAHRTARERFYSNGLYRVFRPAEWGSLGKDRASAIGLQHHGEEVWFRNARVRRLSCQSR